MPWLLWGLAMRRRECLELKRFIAAHGWKMLVADGETQGDLEAHLPFIAARAITNFYRAENDPFENDVLIAGGINFATGRPLSRTPPAAV